MKNNSKFLSREILLSSLIKSFTKLDPRLQIKNPVIFLTLLCSVLSTCYTIKAFLEADISFNFNLQISI